MAKVLFASYALLAVASLGRSAYQISTRFYEAPLAYSLSGFAAIVYLVVFVSLVYSLRCLAYCALFIELIGVVVIGTLSIFAPGLFGTGNHIAATVWTLYGVGYFFLPAALPVLGIIWLSRSKR
ncbi:putative integral membrane protein [Tropheryma whipplei TW08/27]|nr:putative integral membrane protein [Tropheryma whipplei TW08/27]